MFKDKIRWIDIKAIVLFSVAWPIAELLKLKHKDVWLLSERHGEACDNGYWMFKYIKETKQNQEVYYVIDKEAKDRQRIEQYGSIVDFGSFKHYIIYLLTSKHISAHVDSDSPNSRVSNFLEVHRLLKNKKIFLQHGITKDKISFGYYSVSRADLFVCAAKPEYEFCKKEFGYPKGAVQLLGFARFDGLGIVKPKRQILLMPTWRAWLAGGDAQYFKESEYYKRYQALLNNYELSCILEYYNMQLIFYPHSEMKRYLPLFEVHSKRIQITFSDRISVQQLLNESAVLITDYSSVAFDMAYMNRPVLYYQFDYDEYRNGQHPEGYFDYKKDGFGCVVKAETDLINKLKNILCHQNRNEILYKTRAEKFFDLKDRQNCIRIFNSIKEL